MFNLKEFPNILNFIKHINHGYLEDKSSEYLTYCNFCDDKERYKYGKHGHLYLSTTSPVFNCFRCGTSGTLIKLLTFLEYDDKNDLDLLKSKIKYNMSKDFYYELKSKTLNKNNKFKILYDKYNNMITNFPDKYKEFNNYIYSRLGCINPFKYNIYPDMLYPFKKSNNLQLCCCFMNNNCELVTSRFLFNDDIIRYKNIDGNMYYIQDLNFNNYDNLVLTEGPFDMLSTMIYNNNFNISKTLYTAVLGKKYISVLETLIVQYLLLKTKFTINIIFDKDNINYNKFIFKAKKLCNIYNNQLTVKGWMPKYTNDVGEFPYCEPIK